MTMSPFMAHTPMKDPEDDELVTGIELDAYAVIDCRGPMKYAVCAGEARIELGHGTGSLHLSVSEEALARLMEFLGAALRDMCAGVESAKREDAVPRRAAPGE
jgi:hypothetical protein